MDKLTFTTMDAEILYAIPQPPSDILSIVRSFVFLNRAAPPSREELEECLRKAHCAGIVHSVGKKCAVSDKWYEEIHSADQTADNEIEAMLEFTDRLTETEHPAVCDSQFSIQKAEYDSVVEAASRL